MKITLLVLWVVLVYLNLYDLITTVVLLEHDGKELNYLNNWLIGMYGISGLVSFKFTMIAFLSLVTAWISDYNLIIRQKIVVCGSYLIAISYYSYIMYNYNYTYMQSFGT